jgi:iron complex transport system substrate-binding protein
MAAVPTHVTRSATRPLSRRSWGRWAQLCLLAGALGLAVAAGPSRSVSCATGLACLSAQAREAAPARIISLIPATTEMLFTMGAGDQLAGVGSYDRFPPEVARLPRMGGLLDPNVERILSVHPDLVVLYDTQTELKMRLESAGVPTFPYTHRGLSDITGTLRALGRRVGRAEASEREAARIDRELAAVASRVSGKRRPRTLVVIGREAGTIRHISASGGYGFLHDLLELAGGADTVGDIKRQMVQVSTEMILARAPEVIIELQYGTAMKPERLEAERRAWNALPSVPAVKNHRVHLLVGDEFVIPGPRIVSAARRFADVLHGEP